MCAEIPLLLTNNTCKERGIVMERPSRNVNYLLIWWWDRMKRYTNKWITIGAFREMRAYHFLKYLWSENSRNTWVWLILWHVSLDSSLVTIGFYPEHHWENTGHLTIREHISYHILFKVSGVVCMIKMKLLECGLE